MKIASKNFLFSVLLGIWAFSGLAGASPCFELNDKSKAQKQDVDLKKGRDSSFAKSSNKPVYVLLGGRGTAAHIPERVRKQGATMVFIEIPYPEGSTFSNNFDYAKKNSDFVLSFNAEVTAEVVYRKLVDQFGKNTRFVFEGGNDGRTPMANQLRKLQAQRLKHTSVDITEVDFADKSNWSKVLEDHNIPILHQKELLRPNNGFESLYEEVLAFYESIKPSLEPGDPLFVLKPADFSGGKGFFVVQSLSEVPAMLREYNTMIGEKGEPVAKLLVQEYAAGVESVHNYIIPSKVGLSHNERRQAVRLLNTDTNLYAKDRYGRTRIYGHDRLIFDEIDLQKKAGLTPNQILELDLFARRVLLVLNPSPGMIHMEIIMTKNGPRVVDIGNRAPGSEQPVYVSKALGVDVLELMVQAQLDPKAYLQFKGSALRLQPLHHGALLNLSNTTGRVARITAQDKQHLQELMRIPGIVKVWFTVKDDDLIPVAKDLFTGLFLQAEIVGTEEEVDNAIRTIKSFKWLQE